MRLAAPVLLLCLITTAACATPWFTQDPRTLRQGMWRVEEHLLYSTFDNALAGGDEVPLPISDFSSTVYHTRIRYGVTDDLTLFVDAPYVAKRMTANDGTVTRNEDWGDVLVLAKGKYYDNKASRERRAWALAVKLETGQNRGLPPALTTGTGAEDVTLLHLWEKGAGATTWYASAGYTLTGNRRDMGRNPGDVGLLNLAAEHRLGHSSWNFVWELNGRFEDSAHAAGTLVANTGGWTVSASPGFQYVRPRPNGRLLTLEVGVQVPLLKGGDLSAIQDYTAYLGGYTIF